MQKLLNVQRCQLSVHFEEPPIDSINRNIIGDIGFLMQCDCLLVCFNCIKLHGDVRLSRINLVLRDGGHMQLANSSDRIRSEHHTYLAFVLLSSSINIC